jgi:hypothetical protein
MIRIALVSLVLAACGDDGGTHIDAPAANLTLSGEIVDWDSTDALFCGVFGAGLTVHGNTALTDSTNPNGRITLMVPGDASVQIDVTAPTAMSQCETGIGLYQLPAIIMTGSAVINSGKTVSYRMIGMDRIGPFFTGLGVTYDSTKALVFVHVEGTPKAVTSSAAHDAAIAWSGTAWAAGDTGVNVVFPNTPAGMTMVDAPSALGAGSIPTAAGTITYVTLVTN